MRLRSLTVLALAASTALAIAGAARAGDVSVPAFDQWASTPPMGWNSWDSFGTALTEAQAKTQAAAQAQRLKPSGWNLFTVDIEWYQPTAQGHAYIEGARLAMDKFSRLVPAPEKFPSAAGDAGFKPLADFVHGQGLKFGIHIMRGIARQAVQQNTPIKGSSARAKDIALTSSTCPWNPDMYGVDVSKAGGREYYDSLFAMYAAWGVDFVKIDDMSRPYDEVQKAELEAIRSSIDKTGRPIVLSLSPGATPIDRGGHVSQHANMWRIADDFWDEWPPLYTMMALLDQWTPYRHVGAWPDADMLPLGVVDFGRKTRFTPDEQQLCMSMWCIARSPLIFGGDMTKLDAPTLALLTNPDVLAVNQASENNRQVSREGDLIVWAADVPNSKDRYVGLFNATTAGFPYDLDHATYKSDVLRGAAGAAVAEVKVPVGQAKKLVLVVGDGGDGFASDHADWIEPTLTGPAGTLKLTKLAWVKAKAGWGETRVNRTVDDTPIKFKGKAVDGIGTHAMSYIEYALPPGYETFTARGVLSPGSDGHGSVQFAVFVDAAERIIAPRQAVSVPLASLGINGPAKAVDLWSHADLGTVKETFSREIPLHGAGLYRLSQ